MKWKRKGQKRKAIDNGVQFSIKEDGGGYVLSYCRENGNWTIEDEIFSEWKDAKDRADSLSAVFSKEKRIANDRLQSRREESAELAKRSMCALPDDRLIMLFELWCLADEGTRVEMEKELPSYMLNEFSINYIALQAAIAGEQENENR